MVLTDYSELSPVTGLFATVAPKKLASRELDASVGASGPHDFAVRINAARPRKVFALSSLSRPSHPNLTSVTIAKRPLCGPGWPEM
jgi:hypothetical protein